MTAEQKIMNNLIEKAREDASRNALQIADSMNALAYNLHDGWIDADAASSIAQQIMQLNTEISRLAGFNEASRALLPND